MSSMGTARSRPRTYGTMQNAQTSSQPSWILMNDLSGHPRGYSIHRRVDALDRRQDRRRRFALAVVADDLYLGEFGERRAIALRIAAGHDHRRVWRKPVRQANETASLAVGDVRDRAGVDQVGVCASGTVGGQAAVALEFSRRLLSFGLVQLAAQGQRRDDGSVVRCL